MENSYDAVLYTLRFQSCAPLDSVPRDLLSPSTLSSDASLSFQTPPEAAPAFPLTLEFPSSVEVAPAIAAQAPQVRQSAPLSSIPRNAFSPRLPTLASPLVNKQPPHIVEAFLTVQAHIQADQTPKTLRSTCPAVTHPIHPPRHDPSPPIRAPASSSLNPVVPALVSQFPLSTVIPSSTAKYSIARRNPPI